MENGNDNGGINMGLIMMCSAERALLNLKKPRRQVSCCVHVTMVRTDTTSPVQLETSFALPPRLFRVFEKGLVCPGLKALMKIGQ